MRVFMAAVAPLDPRDVGEDRTDVASELTEELGEPRILAVPKQLGERGFFEHFGRFRQRREPRKHSLGIGLCVLVTRTQLLGRFDRIEPEFLSDLCQ